MTTLLDTARYIVSTLGCNPRVHPNGFIQLDLESTPGWNEGKKEGHSGGNTRLHIWNPVGLTLPHQDSDNEIHDHVFDMKSTVVIGRLEQRLYEFIPWDELERDAGPRTHESYMAVYDKKSSSRLEPTGEEGILGLKKSFFVESGESYTQPAFTLHDSDPHDLTVVTIMEKTEIYPGTPTVICKIDSPPDNDFDRSTAVDEETLWGAIHRTLEMDL